MSRLWPFLAAGFASMFLVGLLCWPTLFYPPGSDQGTFAYGARVVLSGGMLYRDAADTKPPGIFLLYALSEWILGGAGAYRRLEPFLLLLAALPLFRIFRKLEWRGFLAAMALLSVWYFAGLSYWDLGQVELPAAVAATAYIAVVLERPVNAPRKFDYLAGLLPGILFILKQHYVLLGFLYLYAVAREAGGPGRFAQTLRSMLPHALGALTPVFVLVVWFAAAGAGLELVRGMFVWPWLYARHASLPAESPLYYAGTLFFHLPVVLLAAAGFALLWRRRLQREAAIILIGTALMLLCSLLQRKLWTYHLVFVLPAAALLAGAGVDWLLRRGVWAGAAIALIVGLDFSAAASNVAHRRERELAHANNYLSAWQSAADLVRHRVSYETFLAGFASYLHPRDGRAPLHRPLQDWRVAQMIAKSCPPGRSLQLIEFRPAVYVLADRRSPHRFFFWSLPSLLGRGGKKLQEEMMAATYSEKRPGCIVFGSGAHWDSPQAMEVSPTRFGYEAVDSIEDDPGAGVRMVLFVDRQSPN